MNINNDLEKLIENLPLFLQTQITQHNEKDQLIEIVLDLVDDRKLVLQQVLNIYLKKLFPGKISIIRQNE